MHVVFAAPVANSDGGFEPTVGQDVENGAFFCEADRVIQRSDGDRSTEANAFGPGRDRREGEVGRWQVSVVGTVMLGHPSPTEAGGLTPCDKVQRFLVD